MSTFDYAYIRELESYREQFLELPTPTDKRRERTDCQGELNARAKLTSADVRDIRRARENGVLYKVLCHRYGISQSHVSRIVHRQQWAHLS